MSSSRDDYLHFYFKSDALSCCARQKLLCPSWLPQESSEWDTMLRRVHVQKIMPMIKSKVITFPFKFPDNVEAESPLLPELIITRIRLKKQRQPFESGTAV